jgi:hypothetical protein
LVAHLGHAPVEHQRLAERAEHDVVRLQVAVDDAAVVRVGHRLAHLDEDLQQPHPLDLACLRRRRAAAVVRLDRLP